MTERPRYLTIAGWGSNESKRSRLLEQRFRTSHLKLEDGRTIPLSECGPDNPILISTITVDKSTFQIYLTTTKLLHANGNVGVSITPWITEPSPSMTLRRHVELYWRIIRSRGGRVRN